MKLRAIASNVNELTLKDGTRVLFSYNTAVACHIPGQGYFKTTTHWSATTSRHITKWLGGAEARPMEQHGLDAMIDRV